MSRSSTPRLPFDSASASNSLKSAFQAELDAVHRAGPGQSKPEVYRPPQAANQSGAGAGGAWGAQGGGWAQPKTNGLMADEKTSFVASLASSLAKAKASNAKR